MSGQSPPDEFAVTDAVAEVARERTALLVVDMQKAFMQSTSSLSQVGLDPERLRPAIPGTLQLVEAARRANVPRIFTRYVYLPGMADFGPVRTRRSALRRQIGSLAFGSTESELLDELRVEDDEFIIDKSRPSAFYGTRLEPLLRSLGTQALVVCGVTTNICVETTVRDAGQRDYDTFVARDAVAEYSDSRHNHALEAIAWTFGQVVSVRDVVLAWTDDT
ncbi:MAG: isochorismatase family protein [Propionibacteriales bacterium]|nr:isochorismatase family protein [Propionibacteriales bacterium]